MKYKHVIWDWNGTLVDDTWLCVEIINKLLKKRNLKPVTIDGYKEKFMFPVREYYIELGFNFEEEPFEVSGLEFINEFKKRLFDAALYSDTEFVLDKLSDQGITHSILSAQNQKMLDQSVNYYNLNDKFIGINGLDNHYANSKVNLGELWIKSLNIDPHNVLMVGDTVHDFEVSQVMGTDCLLLSSGHNSKERLEKTGVKVLDTLESLFNYILSKNYE